MERARFLNRFKYLYSLYQLKQSFGFTCLDAIYDFTKLYQGKGYYDRISMHQYPAEFKSFTEKVKEINPKIVVEIGTKRGGSFFVWARYFKPKHLISIDLPGGIHGGGYPEAKAPFLKSFLSDEPQSRVSLIRGDSHSESALKELQTLLNGETIDFLFIDGDHRYEGVKQDFEMYSSLVRPGGYVGFHDIVSSDYHHGMDCYVDKLWDELKLTYEFQEFIERPDQHKYGLGLIRIG